MRLQQRPLRLHGLFESLSVDAGNFRHLTYAENAGINTGVAAPLPPFAFSGWNERFMGDLHGRDVLHPGKRMIESWPNGRSLKFLQSTIT